MVAVITDTMNYPDGFDRQYNPAGKNEVTEVRFQSSLDGNWNYLLGAIHTVSSGLSVYDIAANGLDALALFPPAVLTGGFLKDSFNYMLLYIEHRVFLQQEVQLYLARFTINPMIG